MKEFSSAMCEGPLHYIHSSLPFTLPFAEIGIPGDEVEGPYREKSGLEKQVMGVCLSDGP